MKQGNNDRWHIQLQSTILRSTGQFQMVSGLHRAVDTNYFFLFLNFGSKPFWIYWIELSDGMISEKIFELLNLLIHETWEQTFAENDLQLYCTRMKKERELLTNKSLTQWQKLIFNHVGPIINSGQTIRILNQIQLEIHPQNGYYMLWQRNKF